MNQTNNILLFSRLENLVKNLQTKSTNTITSTPENNTIVTITTAHSSTSMNTDANKSQPQIATQIQTISPKVLPSNNNTNTISVSGPVTDL